MHFEWYDTFIATLESFNTYLPECEAFCAASVNVAVMRRKVPVGLRVTSPPLDGASVDAASKKLRGMKPDWHWRPCNRLFCSNLLDLAHSIEQNCQTCFHLRGLLHLWRKGKVADKKRAPIFRWIFLIFLTIDWLEVRQLTLSLSSLAISSQSGYRAPIITAHQ